MVFKKPRKMFIAYADSQGRNELLIRDGKNYYVLTSQQKVFPLSELEARRIFKLIEEHVLRFRGAGSFGEKLEIQSTFKLAVDQTLALSGVHSLSEKVKTYWKGVQINGRSS